MRMIEHVMETGEIPEFDFEKECEELLRDGDLSKPSARVLLTPKKKNQVFEILREIRKNHNTSWYRELKNRAMQDYDADAIFYRGTKYTFRQMFEQADKMAAALKKKGIEKGDEISCCISNSPELIFTMIAASKIGARLTMLGTNLDKEYLASIMNGNSKKIFIATDDNYEVLKDDIDKVGYESKLVFSLADSLPEQPELCEGYVADLDRYYHYENKAVSLKEKDSSILLRDEFFDYGSDYEGEVEVEESLNDKFLTTFTSGSTTVGRPKQIVHANKSLIVSGFFNDLEISGSPKIPHQRGMCYIHSDSNTNLVTCISDSLMKCWNVACEPEYGRDVALDVIRMNQPSMIEMTTTHLIQAAKDYFRDLANGVKYLFPNMIATFAVGEGTSPGEEKLLNKFLRISKAGSGVTVKGIRLPFAPLSVGGGDCEHGGIFYNVFNAIKAKANQIITRVKDNGMSPIVFGIFTVLKPTGINKFAEANYNEYGVLVANSETSMIGYKDEKEKTLKKILRDEKGRDWLSCDCYGYIDKAGCIHQKDRVGSEIILGNGNIILPSQIADCVLKDSKNILSCAVTSYHTQNGDIPVINFEFSPLSRIDKTKAFLSLYGRIQNKYGNILGSNILFREFDSQKRFPMTGSGKRDFNGLSNMSLDDVFTINDIFTVFNDQEEIKTEKSRVG